MHEKRIYAALDVGANTIKGVVGEVNNGELIILASAIVKTVGILNGVISDTQEVQSCVKQCVKEMESILGISLTKFVVSIPSTKVELKKLSGTTYLTSSDSVIGVDDITRAIVFSSYTYNDPNNEIVNILPVEYIVNDTIVRNPVGMRSRQLSINAMGVVAPKTTIYPILGVIESCGYEILDICITQIAERHEVFSYLPPTGGYVIVNLGYSSTSVSIYEKNSLKGLGSFKIGANNIVKELADKFNLSYEVARELLNDIGVGFESSHDFFTTIDVKNIDDEKITLDKEEISSFVNYMLLKLLQLIKQEIAKYDTIEVDKIVITGGLIELQGFERVMSRVFGDNAIPYEPKYLGARNSSFIVAFGLIKYIDDKFKSRGNDECSLSNEDIIQLSKPQSKLGQMEDSVLMKIFGYFFD